VAVSAGDLAADPHGDADLALREELVQVALRLDTQGMNRGSTGNLSVRGGRGDSGAAARHGFWITPTGMGAAELRPGGLVWIDDDGTWRGDWQPSSEWPFHRAIYQRRPDLNAVLHTHAVHATAVACLRRPLPAFHYMVAVAGGDSVPCTPYHLFGSRGLSQAVADAFGDRNACLMANHGLVAGGTSLAHALKVMQEIEALCEVYLKTLAAGEPVILSGAQMAEVLERFRTYGQARAGGPAEGRTGR
jgi:L-fuculose-phosphate aldolase